MRVATYGRKSIYSDKSDSVDNQQRMCREFVDFKFPDAVESFECYQDEGFTGANTNAPHNEKVKISTKKKRSFGFPLDPFPCAHHTTAFGFCKAKNRGGQDNPAASFIQTPHRAWLQCGIRTVNSSGCMPVKSTLLRSSAFPTCHLRIPPRWCRSRPCGLSCLYRSSFRVLFSRSGHSC